MTPRIQYGQTADGVSIALTTHGNGAPLIFVPPTPFTNAQLEWTMPEYCRFWEGLSAWATLMYSSIRMHDVHG
jgi:hypothetical protein